MTDKENLEAMFARANITYSEVCHPDEGNNYIIVERGYPSFDICFFFNKDGSIHYIGAYG